MGSKSVVMSLLVSAGSIAAVGTANATVILSPVSAVINSSGPGSGDIDNTFNHSGLVTAFTSGVTDFDTYMGSSPLHNWVFSGNEWFGNFGTTTAVVTYDLGASFTVDRLALWNDEAAGIGVLNLFGSLDGITFSPLATGLTPTDNFATANYPADVFSFAPTSVQFVRFDMSDCPQPLRTEAAPYPSCAVGEVAFSAAAPAVPEPSTLLLLGAGLIAGGRRLRSRRQ